MSTFVARSLISAPSHLALPKPGTHAVGAINLESAAVSLMTDLRQLPAVRIAEDRTLAEAESHMVAAGVRLLFVVDARDLLIGLVTAYDLAGEKPLVKSIAHDAHPDLHAPSPVRVRDIMQPVESWRGIDYPSVQRARVGDIVQTFEQLGQPHLLVFENTEGETPVVRGLFSATQLERVLGVHFNLMARPGSFAEIEQVLSHP
jgi:CBS-domain-containing membrane protein